MIVAVSLADGSILKEEVANRISRQYQLFRSQPFDQQWPLSEFPITDTARIESAFQSMDPFVATELKVMCQQMNLYSRNSKKRVVGGRMSKQYPIFFRSQIPLPYLPPKNDRIASAVQSMDPVAYNQLNSVCQQLNPYFRHPSPSEMAMDHQLELLLKDYTIKSTLNNPTDAESSPTVLQSPEDKELAMDLAMKLTVSLMTPQEKVMLLAELTSPIPV